MTEVPILINVAKMAAIYNTTPEGLYRRMRRDKAKPPELREIPPPVNRQTGYGWKLLWHPDVVSAHLRGENTHAKRGAR